AAPTCVGGTCSFDAIVQQGTHPLTSSQYALQVNAVIGGTSYPANCSFSPTMDPNNPPAESNGSCTFSYSTPGNSSIVAQVIDSVLYSGESSSVDFTI